MAISITGSPGRAPSGPFASKNISTCSFHSCFFFCFAVSPSSRSRASWPVVCFALLAWRLVAVRVIPFGEQWCYITTDSRMDSILWGCILASVEQVPKWRAFLTRANLEQLLAPLGLALLIGTFIFHDKRAYDHAFYSAGYRAAAVSFLCHPLCRDSGRPLPQSTLTGASRYSQLWALPLHYPIIALVRAHARTSEPIVWVLCAIASYVAALSHALDLGAAFRNFPCEAPEGLSPRGYGVEIVQRSSKFQKVSLNSLGSH